MPLADALAAQDYCQYGKNTVLLFVDRTTPYDDQDRAVFAEGLELIFKRLRIGDQVVIHTIEDSFGNSRQVFVGCYPGCPEGGVFDWFMGSCQAMEARGDRFRFEQGLARLGRDMLNKPMSFPFSDIAQTVAFITRSYQSRGKAITHVYVFSDLVENSREMPWPSILKASPEDFAKRISIEPALKDGHVAVFGFGRWHDANRRPLMSHENHRLRTFWEGFFRAMGARATYIGQRLGEATN